MEFYYVGESGKPVESINFLKRGNPLEILTVEDHTNHMRDAFRRFGYSGYSRVLMEWNRGFGNSVIVQVILDKPD